jgi:hypothetical protein
MRFVDVSGKKATLIPVGDKVDGLAYFQTQEACRRPRCVRSWIGGIEHPSCRSRRDA